jgi:predicted nucleic acid-binding protein
VLHWIEIIGEAARGVSDKVRAAHPPVDLTSADYAQIADLVNTYESLPLGTTDASVVAIAERLGLTDVATLDRRQFTVVRPSTRMR